MPLGLLAFELFASKTVQRLRSKQYLQCQASGVGKSVQKYFSHLLTRARPSEITKLLFVVSLYLVFSRCGPVLTRVGESAFKAFEFEQIIDPVGLESLKAVYRVFRNVVRVPGPFAKRSSCSTLEQFIMGNFSGKSDNDDSKRKASEPKDEGVKVKNVEELGGQPTQSSDTTSDQAAAKDPPVTTKTEKSYSVSSESTGTEAKPVEFDKVEDNIATGDLAVLYREGQDLPHFAVFLQRCENDANFPLLLIKGKTKPLQLFDPKIPRHAHMVSAVTRIFYGDYSKVAVRHLLTNKKFDCSDIMKLVDEMEKIPFTEKEIQAAQSASTPEDRSRVVCTFMVAHLYQQLGVLTVNPTDVTPTTLQDNLELSDPTYIKLPPVKPGPVATGEAPLLFKLVEGIFPPPEVVKSPFGSIVSDLQTGDLVLFSGATSSGAIIKFFDHSQFSHCGIVLRTKFNSQLLVWEASTNKAGLVDVSSGKVQRGVELLPLKSKIFSGWYDRVAIRRLTGIDDEKRAQMYAQLLEFRKEIQGRPYEQSKVELVLSAIDVQEEYLSFLRNTHEDLSSLFCSELVAEAYKRMGILDTEKLSNEFTPDDFSSERDKHLTLKMGKLEKEIYIELKFDFLST